VDALLGEINIALADSRKARQERLKPSLEGAPYQKSLLDLVRQLNRSATNWRRPSAPGQLMNLAPRHGVLLGRPGRLEAPIAQRQARGPGEQAC